MKFRLLVPTLCLSLLLLPVLRAQNAGTDFLGALVANDALDDVIKKVRTKAEAGQRSPEALAPELKELDEHIATFASDKEAAGRFALMKAMIYAEVINDLTKAREVLRGVKRDYPGTGSAADADKALVSLEKAEQRQAADPELQPLLQQIQAKAKAGERTATALAAEIAQLDTLVAKYAANPEAAAYIAFMQAMIHAQVIGDLAKGRELLLAVQKKYAGTTTADATQQVIDQIDEFSKRQAAPAGKEP